MNYKEKIAKEILTIVDTYGDDDKQHLKVRLDKLLTIQKHYIVNNIHKSLEDI